MKANCTQTDRLYLPLATCDFRRNTGSDVAERISFPTCVWLQRSGRTPAGSDLAALTQISVTSNSI